MGNVRAPGLQKWLLEKITQGGAVEMYLSVVSSNNRQQRGHALNDPKNL